MPLSDIVDKNLLYSYEDGRKYSLWLKSPTRLVYSIHSGPIKGRNNYLSCTIQEIRPGEIFQVGLLEETGTTASLVVDLALKRITSWAAFSKGPSENPTALVGDKRNPVDFARWRELAKIGSNVERIIASGQATIERITQGRGDMDDIDPEAETI